MPPFPAIFLALWTGVFFVGWLLLIGPMFLDGHWFIGGLFTAGFTWAINVGVGIARGMAGDPPREDP